MIARLGPENPLHNHGRYILFSPPANSKSWFLSVRHLCQQYLLPDPLLILQSPPTSAQWKTLCKSRVMDFHEQKLRSQASLLSSLKFFKPSFMSLSSPHPIWLHANSPYEVSKAVIAARMLSGRYRTDMLSRHWTPDNPDGLCRLPGCSGQQGSIEHVLLHCPALSDSRTRMLSLWSSFLVNKPELFPVIKQYTLVEDHLLPQFLLDPSCLPLVISSNRTFPDTLKHCLYLARTWCFSTHISRSKILKTLNKN